MIRHTTNDNRAISDVEDMRSAQIEALTRALRESLEACRKIVEFHDEMFVGRPLCIDGKPIDHTKLNEATRLADSALKKANGAR